MMGGMAVRSLGLSDGKGVQIYEFDQIPSTKDHIAEWHQELNNLQLTEAEKQEIVDRGKLCLCV